MNRLLVLLIIFLCWGTAAAEPLAEAREALEKGRGDLALPLLTGQSVEERVSRLQAYCELDDYTQARQLLSELEREKHGDFPPPYDYHFYLYRGVVEEAAQNDELALKNFGEALRRADSPEQRVLARLRVVELWEARDQLEKAEEEFESLWPLIPDLKARPVLARVHEVSASLQEKRGRNTGPALDGRTARELYLLAGHRTRAAEALYDTIYYTDRKDDLPHHLEVVEQVFQEFLAVGDYHNAISSCQALGYLYFSLANSPQGDRVTPLLKRVVAAVPAGENLERAKLAQAVFELETDNESEETHRSLLKLTASTSREIRCQAHQKLGLYHGERGEREQALEELKKALALSSGQLRKDRDWTAAPGPILLRMAYQEKARHNNEEAIRLTHQGLEAQPGEDWRYWRVEARYGILMAALESSDRRTAAQELAASLNELERLPALSSRVGSLTTILSSLLLNQSVEADVLDPAELLLGEYPETTRELIRDIFIVQRSVDGYLAEFDEWHRQLAGRGEKSLAALPLIYKGLFLEALGRMKEAEGVLKSALRSADEQEYKMAQMLSRVLLARIYLSQGRSDEAVGDLTRAAEVAETLNPLAARFYLLVAGSAQRRYGDPSTALDTFERAALLKPEKAWSAHFGRALALEKLRRPMEALEAVERALDLIGDSERLHSVAEMRAARARLLASLGREEEALKLYQQAQDSLEFSQALPAVTLEYGELLEALQQDSRALEVYGRTLEILAESGRRLDANTRALYERTVTLALKIGENQQALRYLHLSRSAELLEAVDLSEVAADDKETNELLNQVDTLRQKLVRLREESGRAADASSRENIGQQVAATRGEFFNKLNELREREPDFEAVVQVTGSQLAAVQKLLPEKTALLEYFPAENTLYVFLVTSENFSIHQVSVPREALARMSERLTKLCTDPTSDREDYRELSRTLYDALIGVTGERLQGVESLRLIPSGSLWEVPFAALTAPDGEVLCRRFELSYLGSSELLKVLDRRTGGSALSPALLVQGAEDLKGAKVEVSRLAGQFSDATVLNPSDLSAEQFREAVKGRRLVHVASHSVVNADESYLQLGADRLALGDVYGLELESSSLVVLSSCRSGVGVSVSGKEVTSLATAFSVAGASAVVASRWSVDDSSTARFFELFYQALSRGRSRGEALREAQELMAREKPEPYYWAAFSLLGDPR